MSIDVKTGALAQEIKGVLERHFGDRLAAVYLFGSRARGEHRPDSDLDLAIVLRHIRQPLSSVDQDLLDLTYPIEIERGVHVQAWALSLESMSMAEGEPAGPAEPGMRGRLAATVRREGVRL
jgi:predicted nucleotidyltransferase